MAIPTITSSDFFTEATSVTNRDITFTVSSNSGRVLLAWATFNDGGPSTQTTNSVTFDPGGGDEDAFTLVDYVNNDGAGRNHTSMWWLALDDGVDAGDYTIRATFSEEVYRSQIHVWEVDGADTTDPIGAYLASSGYTNELTVTITTTDTNSLVAAGGQSRASTAFTATHGTEVTDSTLNYCSAYTGYINAATVDDWEVAATQGGVQYWTMVGAEILEAGAGPSGNPWYAYAQQ